MRCMISWLKESEIFPGNHDRKHNECENSFDLARRLKNGGPLRRKLRRLWNQSTQSHIRQRRVTPAVSTAIDSKRFDSLLEELRELNDELESITKSPGRLERQRAVNVCSHTASVSDAGGVELDHLVASVVQDVLASGARSNLEGLSSRYPPALETTSAADSISVGSSFDETPTGTEQDTSLCGDKREPYLSSWLTDVRKQQLNGDLPRTSTAYRRGNTPSLDHYPLPTNKELFAIIMDNDRSTRKVLLDKLNKGRRQLRDHSDSTKRIIRDMFQVEEYANLPETFSIAPIEDDIFNCLGTIYGPAETPYEGGIFYLKICFTPDYPFKPPKIRFLTKVLHPNISSDGHIYLDVLRETWSPALTISHVLLMISSFLDIPNPDQSLSPEIARQYKKDRGLYIQNVRLHTQRYATGAFPPLSQIVPKPPASLVLSQRVPPRTTILARGLSRDKLRLNGLVKKLRPEKAKNVAVEAS